MPFAFGLLVGAQLLGEALRLALHLPLPGPVIGMFLFALWLIGPGRRLLQATDGNPSPLVATAQGLITNMGLLFVPAGVGIIAEFSVLRESWLPIVAGLLLSTLLGLVVTAAVMHYVSRAVERRTPPAEDA